MVRRRVAILALVLAAAGCAGSGEDSGQESADTGTEDAQPEAMTADERGEPPEAVVAEPTGDGGDRQFEAMVAEAVADFSWDRAAEACEQLPFDDVLTFVDDPSLYLYSQPTLQGVICTYWLPDAFLAEVGWIYVLGRTPEEQWAIDSPGMTADREPLDGFGPGAYIVDCIDCWMAVAPRGESTVIATAKDRASAVRLLETLLDDVV